MKKVVLYILFIYRGWLKCRVNRWQPLSHALTQTVRPSLQAAILVIHQLTVTLRHSNFVTELFNHNYCNELYIKFYWKHVQTRHLACVQDTWKSFFKTCLLCKLFKCHTVHRLFYIKCIACRISYHVWSHFT